MALVGATLVLLGVVGSGRPVQAAATLSLDTPIPNYYYDASQPQANGNGTGTVPFADPANGLLFEYTSGYSRNGVAQACPTLVAMNIDTNAVVATNGSGYFCPTYEAAGTNTPSPSMAVDSTDRLLFFTLYGGGQQPDTIAVVDETTLVTRATWTLPPGVTVMNNLSWDAQGDELLGLGAAESLPISSAHGVVLVDINIPASLQTPAGAQPQAAVVNWSVILSQCTSLLFGGRFAAAAHLSRLQEAAYVPCVLAGSDQIPQGQFDHEGVVKLLMTTTRCAPPATSCPALDTLHQPVALAAVAPAQGLTDFLFDGGADRGYMPSTGSNSGQTVYVYSGGPAPQNGVLQNGSFIGRFAVGNVADATSLVYALDQTTGRLYAAGPGTGVTLIDGRRTPVNAGASFAQFRGSGTYELLPVLPPDAAHPATRLLLNYATASFTLPSFTVVDDAVPVSQDPVAANPDLNTQVVPPGEAALVNYGGTVRAYGFHSDLVGGTGGPVNNALQPPPGFPNGNSLPYGNVVTDALGGDIGSLRLSNGNGAGQAAAVEPGNSSVSAEYTAQTHGQPWPYPDALCINPGGTVTASQTGTQTSNGQSGDATQASATVACADPAPQPAAAGWNGGQTPPTGSSWAMSRVQGARLVGSGYGSVGIGPSTAAAYAAPPAGKIGAGSYVFAQSSGVRIDFGAAGSVSFGEVSQTVTVSANGLPGGAHATRTVVLGDVVLTLAGQAPQPLCASVCSNDAAVIDQLNNAFASQMHVSQPAPDAGLFAGTPGGYTAGVEADASQQYGDEQFNGMSAEEAALLPALRIVLYDDGAYQLSRWIIDLAGVSTATYLGNTPVPPVAGVVNSTVAAIDAGLGPYIGGTTTTYGSVAGASITNPNGDSGGGGGPLGGLVHVLGRVFGGLGFLLRNPLEAAEMIGSLLLLGLPLLFMERRRLWLRDVFGHQHG
ncbi:MAG: hypothetical protein ACYDAC_04845 [Candidatus Dormibacteria bacterium]